MMVILVIVLITGKQYTNLFRMFLIVNFRLTSAIRR